MHFSSVIERQRRLHSEIEGLEDLAVNELINPLKYHREKIIQDHHIKVTLDKMIELNTELSEIYQDEDGNRQKEVESLTVTDLNSPGNEFYKRLHEIQSFYSDSSNFFNTDDFSIVDEVSTSVKSYIAQGLTSGKLFSGEETNGKYLDLHSIYETYLNLKGLSPPILDYYSWMSTFHDVKKLACNKNSKLYAAYLENLISYLTGFISRAMPLFDLDSWMNAAKDEFQSNFHQEQASHRLEDKSLLFCVPCNHQFTNKSVYEAHLKGKKHLKASDNLNKEGTQGKGLADDNLDSFPISSNQKEWHEFVLQKIVTSVLSDVQKETKAFIERKLARSSAEIQEQMNGEDEEELIFNNDKESFNEQDEEEHNSKFYNPLNIPLGWDGKPIPYWLWKLHGLGVSYSCEICGDTKYMGKKAFDRHFQEWRHVYGMKCLGIPNTKHFAQVTSIADAQALWDKLKKNTKAELFKPDAMEEVEDEAGNIYQRKTYEDLKRQGLL